MKKTSLKFTKSIINFLMVLILLFSLIALGLSVYCRINFNQEIAKYIYALIGVFLIPIEYLMNGKVGIFAEQDYLLLANIIPIALIIFAIAVLISSSKMFDGQYSTFKRTIFGTIAIFLIFVFLAMFALAIFVLGFNFSKVSNLVNNSSPDFIKNLVVNMGVNIIMIKELVMASLGFVGCVVAFIIYIIGMAHKSTKVKIVSSINFYSSEYQEPVQESRVKTKDEGTENTQSNDIKESNPKAKELIEKIMKLDELRNAGKISNTEYTRLRQKIIRRYQGE